jgi:hypothetical protein
MFWLLWRILIGIKPAPKCQHEWELFKTIEVYDPWFSSKDMPAGMKYILQCKKCGDLKIVHTNG